MIGRSRAEKVERLPVIISSCGLERLLGVPSIHSAKGAPTADAVFETLVQWEVVDKVEAMCFDTTAANTGYINGACKFLQTRFGRDLLPLACRHHEYDVVLRKAFETKFGKTKAPENAFFEKYRKAREQNKIDVTKFKSGISDKFVRAKLPDKIVRDIIAFCRRQLTNAQPRSDYKKFLQLAIIFLGETVENFKFPLPGPTSEARWMAKAIYLLEMFIFRDQYDSGEAEKVRDIRGQAEK